MAIIKLTSANPELSYILYKNPASGIQLRRIRKGMGYGWYDGAQSYLAYFTDQGTTSLSFRPNREEEFHYLNASQYQAPLVYLSLITEFYGHPLKPQEQDKEGFEHTLELPFIAIKREHFLVFFQRQFPDIQFDYEELTPGHGRLVIQTTRTLHDLLHAAQLFLLFQALFAKEFLDESETLIQKYVQSLNAVDAPFYIRNLFVRNFLSRRNYFKQFIEEAAATDRYTIEFSFGGTGLQRRNLAESLLDFNYPILDIGCGEGFYIASFSKQLGALPYYAVDIDPEVLEIAQKKAEKRELENVSFYPSIANWEKLNITEPIDVLLMEVIEHMPKEEAAVLIQAVLEKTVHQVVLSTPNKEFNPYYSLTDDKKRHEDHCWEMTQSEFQEWLSAIIDQELYSLEFLAIGDKVDGIPTTQGARIIRKETEA
ncbi:methyltransferase domain-containing protein [Enterococcus larvae]|uniref:methyltransferase domain-containing protein n=1 Tax=Enterococcus larvae TaxID=2794352 RepID=UPI003F2C9E38